MKPIKIIAISQLVLAIIFAVAAWRLDPGIAHLSKQFSETCHELGQTMEGHKRVYDSLVKRTLQLRGSLQDVSRCTHWVSDSTKGLSNSVRKMPGMKVLGLKSKCDLVAQNLDGFAERMDKTSEAFYGASVTFAEYEKDGYPQAIATFDKVIVSLNQAEDALAASSRNSRFLIRFLTTLSSLIFLLNAVAFWMLAGKKNEEKAV